MRKPIIAIDGYSSTGKSSISKEIAKRLDIIHLDTGALYRGITFFALENCVKDGVIDFENLFSRFTEVHLEFQKKENSLVLYLNGKDISTEIRTQRISDNVSQIAKQSEVREFLLHTQREIARTGGVILDGRDIGSVVLPDADYKFFLTASVDKRTERRYKELKEMGMETSMKEVRENLLTRDKIDSEREIAPLIQPEDAILIDNSDIDKEQTIELILSYIK
jgi:cytidylate kinase